MNDFEIAKLKEDDAEITVYISSEDQTIYLSQKDIAILFNTTKGRVSYHLINIFKELPYLPTVQEIWTVQQEGTRIIKRKIKLYELAYIEEMGRRLRSNKAAKIKEFVFNYLRTKNEEQLANNDIIIYDNGAVHIPLQISLDEQTIWSTEQQIAKIFETSRQNINYHIRNIFIEDELNRDSVRKEYLHTGTDGKSYLVHLYNLDMVLAIGFRIKTSKAISFRKWSYDVLLKVIKQGFYLHEPRCIECRDTLQRIENQLTQINNENQIEEFNFEPGTELASFTAVERFLRHAKIRIIIVDNYFGHEFDAVFSEINVNKTIITNPKNKKIETNKSYSVVKSNLFHDRYILVDDICFSFGQSVNELGTKFSTSKRCKDKKIIKRIIQTASIKAN